MQLFKMDTTFEQEHINYYKQSLQDADNEIKTEKEKGKALKDIVGKAYENHRKRVWEHFGFDVSKNKHNALFDIDWSISYKGKLIAMEEDKGHYLDSCFLERALTGFAKTVNSYQKSGTVVPTLIIHSFAKYSKFDDKKMEDLDTRKPAIADELLKKIVYTTMTKCDRLPKHKWFSDNDNCYYDNADDELIIQDIAFIQTLIPQ
jgi:hypothetical protein